MCLLLGLLICVRWCIFLHCFVYFSVVKQLAVKTEDHLRNGFVEWGVNPKAGNGEGRVTYPQDSFEKSHLIISGI